MSTFQLELPFLTIHPKTIDALIPLAGVMHVEVLSYDPGNCTVSALVDGSLYGGQRWDDFQGVERYNNFEIMSTGNDMKTAMQRLVERVRYRYMAVIVSPYDGHVVTNSVAQASRR